MFLPLNLWFCCCDAGGCEGKYYEKITTADALSEPFASGACQTVCDPRMPPAGSGSAKAHQDTIIMAMTQRIPELEPAQERPEGHETPTEEAGPARVPEALRRRLSGAPGGVGYSGRESAVWVFPTPSFVCRKTMGSSPMFRSIGRF